MFGAPRCTKFRLRCGAGGMPPNEANGFGDAIHNGATGAGIGLTVQARGCAEREPQGYPLPGSSLAVKSSNSDSWTSPPLPRRQHGRQRLGPLAAAVAQPVAALVLAALLGDLVEGDA